MKRTHSILITAMAIGAAGCSSSSNNGTAKSSSATSTKSAGLDVAITQVQGLAKKDWRVDATSRVWTYLPVLKIKGTCSSGVTSVIATNTSTLAMAGSQATCVDGQFEWTSSSLSDGQHSFLFKSKTANQSSKSQTMTFYVDTTVPPAPVLINHPVQNFVSRTSLVLLRGGVPVNVYRIKLSGPKVAEIMPMGGNFDAWIDLNVGQTGVFTLRSQSFAGAESEPTRISIAYMPGLALSGVGFGGTHSVSRSGGLQMSVGITSAPRAVVQTR